MTPYYDADGITLYHGDALLIHEWTRANVLVTDPPYGRDWRQGDTGSGRGWVSDAHKGIIGDIDNGARDQALELWGGRPAIVFGDLMLPPPEGVKHVLIYDKGGSAGFTGAIGGFRRNAEAIYLLGKWPSGLGGRSSVISTRTSAGGNLARRWGHPHTKPQDVLEVLIRATEGEVIADPFSGCGSTLLAARAQGRKAIGVEIEEWYCEVTATRLAQGDLFGETA